MSDPISPAHYQGFSNGAEVIDITECLPFNAGNAIKYLARAGRKHRETHVEDLRKALWYVRRELARLTGEPEPEPAPAPMVTPTMAQLVVETYGAHTKVDPIAGRDFCGTCGMWLADGLTSTAHARNAAAAVLEDALAKATPSPSALPASVVAVLDAWRVPAGDSEVHIAAVTRVRRDFPRLASRLDKACAEHPGGGDA